MGLNPNQFGTRVVTFGSKTLERSYTVKEPIQRPAATVHEGWEQAGSREHPQASN